MLEGVVVGANIVHVSEPLGRMVDTLGREVYGVLLSHRSTIYRPSRRHRECVLLVSWVYLSHFIAQIRAQLAVNAWQVSMRSLCIGLKADG